MTDPRPAEGPDREALAEALYRNDVRRGGMAECDREQSWPLYLADADAVLALLPSPPGVAETTHCSEHGADCGGDHRGRDVRGLCCGHARSRHDSFGHCQRCSDPDWPSADRYDCPGWLAPPAPGGGDTDQWDVSADVAIGGGQGSPPPGIVGGTDLRAVAATFLAAEGRRCGVCTGRSPSWDGHDKNPPCETMARAALTAALAARPDADRDALARAVQAEVARCEERVTESVAYTLPWLNRAFVAGVNASRQVTARHLRAALARDAEGSGQ